MTEYLDPQWPSYVNEVHSKGKVYFYLRPPAEARGIKGLKLHTASRIEAERLAREILSRDGVALRASEQRHMENIERALAVALKSARSRARQQQLAIDLTVPFLVNLAQLQGWRCVISGIPFRLTTALGRRVRREPFRPSIDRIEGHLGYVRGNVRLTCVAVNIALGAWGEQVFYELVTATANRLQKNETGPQLQNSGG